MELDLEAKGGKQGRPKVEGQVHDILYIFNMSRDIEEGLKKSDLSNNYERVEFNLI